MLFDFNLYFTNSDLPIHFNKSIIAYKKLNSTIAVTFENSYGIDYASNS